MHFGPIAILTFLKDTLCHIFSYLCQLKSSLPFPNLIAWDTGMPEDSTKLYLIQINQSLMILDHIYW